MQNPAANLLKTHFPERSKTKKVKIHFLLWGIILAFFVVVGLFFDRGVWQGRRDSASQAAIAHFLPENTQILVWLNLNLEENSVPSRLFALYNRWAAEVGRPQADDQLKEFLNVLPGNLADNLLKQSQELAWAKLGSLGEVAILKFETGKEIADILQANLPSENIAQSDASFFRAISPQGEEFYYFLRDQYLFFSTNEQGIRTIVNLAESGAETLESASRFNQMERSFYTPSPLFVYFNLGEDYPAGARISEINEKGASLEIYYNQKTQGQAEQMESAWLRLIPKDPIFLLAAAGNNTSPFFNFQDNYFFIDLIWPALDPDSFIQKILAVAETADLSSSGWEGLELSASLNSDQSLATTLILASQEQNIAELDRATALFQDLAAQGAPQEENTILADGSQITEYVLGDKPSPRDIELLGVAFKAIDLTPEHCLFYGYLADRLLISDSREALSGIITSFRSPQPENWARVFSGGREWFYLDLEKMENFGRADSWPGLKKIQAASQELKSGLLIKIWLEI